jgi:hypothetical protein
VSTSGCRSIPSPDHSPGPLLRRSLYEAHDAAQVQPPVPKHRQEHRVLPGRTRDGDPSVRLLFREVGPLGAPREQGMRGLAGVEPSGVDLRDVGDEVGLVVAGPVQDVEQATEQLVVRNGPQIRSLSHGRSMGRAPATGGPFGSESPWATPSGVLGFVRPHPRMAMPLRLGEQLGPHEIACPLGAGGTGGVYRAREITPQMARPRVL